MLVMLAGGNDGSRSNPGSSCWPVGLMGTGGTGDGHLARETLRHSDIQPHSMQAAGLDCNDAGVPDQTHTFKKMFHASGLRPEAVASAASHTMPSAAHGHRHSQHR